MLTTSRARLHIISAGLLLVAQACASLVYANEADSTGHAEKFLRVTNAAEKFESTAAQQTRAIIRSYASIVSMSVNVALPAQLRNAIAACYEEAYAWERFEAGLVAIVADMLSSKELLLLIDFYQDRGLPPMEIDTFKNALTKADQIADNSADFIFANSNGCVEQDAEIIIGYLSDLGFRAEAERLLSESAIDTPG